MFILFFCIHILFAAALFFIHAYIEAGIFIFLGIVSFFIFSPFRFKKENSHTEHIEETLHTTKTVWKEKTTFFFQKMLFPLTLLSFYWAIFGIVWTLEDVIWFSVQIFFVGITLILAFSTWFGIFFIKNEKIRSLLQIHTELFLGIWGIYNSILFWEKIPVFVGISNSILLGVAALLFYKKIFFSNRFLLVLVASIYFTIITVIYPLVLINIFILISNILIIWGILFFESAEIYTFKSKSYFLRLIGVFSLYVGSVGLLFLYLFQGLPIFSISILILSIIFHLYLHKRFENYVSFFLALLSITLLYGKYIGIPESFLTWIISVWIFAFGLSFFGAKQFSIRMYDKYFTQGFAIGVPIIWYISRWVIFGFWTLLEFFLLLLFFSLLFFVSYIRVSIK